jgi:hypothetical protein
MDLDPEAVKLEIEAVKVACNEVRTTSWTVARYQHSTFLVLERFQGEFVGVRDTNFEFMLRVQVNARLRGRGHAARPTGNILSRLSKVAPGSEQGGPEGQQHAEPPVNANDRNSSRRFVVRVGSSSLHGLRPNMRFKQRKRTHSNFLYICRTETGTLQENAPLRGSLQMIRSQKRNISKWSKMAISRGNGCTSPQSPDKTKEKCMKILVTRFLVAFRQVPVSKLTLRPAAP